MTTSTTSRARTAFLGVILALCAVATVWSAYEPQGADTHHQSSVRPDITVATCQVLSGPVSARPAHIRLDRCVSASGQMVMVQTSKTG